MKNILVIAIAMLAVGSGQAQSFVKNAEDRARIERALPEKAHVIPANPRRLLIFTLNVGYGGHPSMAHANEAFTLMGRKTRAFETEVSNDPAIFSRQSLKRFDAVFFNNTVGNCFTNAELRQDLLEFITGGGGLLGVHGTSVAFTHWPGAIEDWPEFGYLIGARGANHKDSDEHIWMKVEDPHNPITRLLGTDGFDYRDEFFRPQGTYSRNRVRVLLSIDTTKCDPDKGQPRGDCYRADHDYAVAWIRNYGQGRVFYCTIAHNPYVFWDAKMLQFYLGAAQFVLGDLKCATTPSAKLTPAVGSQEALGWRVALQSGREATFAADVENAAKLQLAYIGASGAQQVSPEIRKPFDPSLTDQELGEIRLKLEAAGLRLLSYTAAANPSDDAGWHKLFEFGRKMGIETFICEPAPKALDLIEKLSGDYHINVAIGAKRSRDGLSPRQVLNLCRNRSEALGASVQFDREDNAAEALRERLLVADIGELRTNAGGMKKLLTGLRRMQLKPIFLISGDEAAVRSGIEGFNATCLEFQSFK